MTSRIDAPSSRSSGCSTAALVPRCHDALSIDERFFQTSRADHRPELAAHVRRPIRSRSGEAFIRAGRGDSPMS
jgi:hypothetical protein